MHALAPTGTHSSRLVPGEPNEKHFFLGVLLFPISTAEVWCLDHADCAVEVSQRLLDSLTEKRLDAQSRRGGRANRGMNHSCPVL